MDISKAHVNLKWEVNKINHVVIERQCDYWFQTENWSVCYGPNYSAISTAFIWEKIYVIQLFEDVTTFSFLKMVCNSYFGPLQVDDK